MTYLSPGHMTLATLSYIISTASRRPYIKFTMEREEDGTLPFRMCLWLTIHKATPYRLRCTENQQIYPLSILPPLFHQECMESFKSCSINQKDHMPGSRLRRMRFLTLLPTECIAIHLTSSAKLFDIDQTCQDCDHSWGETGRILKPDCHRRNCRSWEIRCSTACHWEKPQHWLERQHLSSVERKTGSN